MKKLPNYQLRIYNTENDSGQGEEYETLETMNPIIPISVIKPNRYYRFCEILRNENGEVQNYNYYNGGFWVE